MSTYVQVDPTQKLDPFKAVKKLPIDQVSKNPLVAPFDIHGLDLPEGLKQLLEDKKWDLNFLLQVEPSVLAQRLGIDEDIAKLIIKAAKNTNSK